MYTALYRTFRPEIFGDIIGQEHIVKILKNQLAKGTVSHAYLFCGTRGTGKTSTARILAKGLNCTAESERPCGECENCKSIREGVFLDVVEIDAASNNGVDNIRELRESVKYAPVSGRNKVYIIDEVHMLSPGAFNALLKTLEEPPENVVFILATTEPQKLPATILSRCLRLDFRRVPETLLKKSMREICEKLDIKISGVALGIIAANADGSVRDGLSLLDQCIAGGDQSVSREEVLDILGTSGEDVFIEMTDCILEHDTAGALILLERVLSDGKDVRQFIKDLIAHYRGLLMTKFMKSPEDMLSMSWENVERIRGQSEKIQLYDINDSIIELSKTAADAKWSTQPRILLELCLVRLASPGGAEGSGQIAGEKLHSPSPVAESRAAGQVPTVTEGRGPLHSPQEDSVGAQYSAESGNGVQSSTEDCEALWHTLFERAEGGKASFNLLRNGAHLKKVNEANFTVAAESDMMVMYLKDNRELIEKIITDLVGRSMRMEISQGQEKPQSENFAETLSSKLGINIEIV